MSEKAAPNILPETEKQRLCMKHGSHLTKNTKSSFLATVKWHKLLWLGHVTRHDTPRLIQGILERCRCRGGQRKILLLIITCKISSPLLTTNQTGHSLASLCVCPVVSPDDQHWRTTAKPLVNWHQSRDDWHMPNMIRGDQVLSHTTKICFTPLMNYCPLR